MGMFAFIKEEMKYLFENIKYRFNYHIGGLFNPNERAIGAAGLGHDSYLGQSKMTESQIARYDKALTSSCRKRRTSDDDERLKMLNLDVKEFVKAVRKDIERAKHGEKLFISLLNQKERMR
jgi:hypothetical protein